MRGKFYPGQLVYIPVHHMIWQTPNGKSDDSVGSVDLITLSLVLGIYGVFVYILTMGHHQMMGWSSITGVEIIQDVN